MNALTIPTPGLSGLVNSLVNPFNQRQSGKAPEKVTCHQADTEAISDIARFFEKYTKRISSGSYVGHPTERHNMIERLLTNNITSRNGLRPLELAAAFSYLGDRYPGLWKRYHEALSALVNRSYISGNNLFKFMPVDNQTGFCWDLHGTEERRMKVEVTGNVGHHFGSHSTYCDFTVNGDAESTLGTDCSYCTFDLTGYGGDMLGRNSYECSFTVHGNIGTDPFMSSNSSIFEIEGKFKQMIYMMFLPRDCTFSVKDHDERNKLEEALDENNTLGNVVLK
jgi:hypothetical protein